MPISEPSEPPDEGSVAFPSAIRLIVYVFLFPLRSLYLVLRLFLSLSCAPVRAQEEMLCADLSGRER